MGKSKPKPPETPNYQASAQQQADANMKAGLQSTSLSNPNIYGPYGNQTVSYAQSGPNGEWQPTVTQSLTPDAQRTLEAQQRVELGQAQLGERGLQQVNDIMGTPFQYSGPGIQTSFNYNPARTTLGDYGQVQSSLGDYGRATGDLDLSGIAKMPVNAGMTGQQAIMSRLNPQIEQDRAAFDAKMANQGVVAGGEAYNNAFRNQSQSENDLKNQAALYGINLDLQANNQGYNQALQSGQFRNAAQQQNFAQALGAGEFANSAQQQRYGQELGSAGFYNQGVAQNYNQGLGAATFGNQAVAQNLQHQLGLYNQPLNQINALMSGSQIQAPQFQQYSGAQIGAAPIYEATKDLGTYQQGIYGQQMSGYNAGMQALGSAVGGLAGMATGPKPFSLW